MQVIRDISVILSLLLNPLRHSNLCKVVIRDNIFLRSGPCQCESYRDKHHH